MVAYLILSYTPHVDRLVAALRAGSPDAVIAVHHDDRHCPLPEVDAMRIEPRPIEWGHGSQLAAVLRCLRWLRERADFDWLVLLSGQDYPIKPVPEIEAGMYGTDAFIDARPVAPRSWRRHGTDEFALRYRYRWRPVSPRVAALAARAAPLAHVRALPSGTYMGLPAEPPMSPYRGSDWFSVSRKAVDVVLAADADHFLHTIVPTEAFVHTVLANSPLPLYGDHRRFACFEDGSANPRVLGFGDLYAALASGADFARKFDDPAVLDEIDRRLTSAPR